MWLLDGEPISPDMAFEKGGVTYPPGYITSATADELTALGITWVDQQPMPDTFYARVVEDPDNPGQWLTYPYTPEEMQPRLARYSREARDGKLLSGIEQTIGTHTFLIPTDVQTRNSFFTFRVIQERPGAPTTTPVEMTDKTTRETVALALTEAQLLSIEMKMETRVRDCGSTQIVLQQGIQDGTVTTKEQIDAAYEAVP